MERMQKKKKIQEMQRTKVKKSKECKKWKNAGLIKLSEKTKISTNA